MIWRFQNEIFSVSTHGCCVLYCTIEEQACSTAGKCTVFCAGGPQFDSH